MMGGRIWVESELGEGSVFHFVVRFPRATEKPPGLSRIEPAAVGETRVLIVDDNSTNRLILEEITRNWGMRPTAVAGARQAIDLLRHARRSGGRLISSFPT